MLIYFHAAAEQSSAPTATSELPSVLETRLLMHDVPAELLCCSTPYAVEVAVSAYSLENQQHRKECPYADDQVRHLERCISPVERCARREARH